MPGGGGHRREVRGAVGWFQSASVLPVLCGSHRKGTVYGLVVTARRKVAAPKRLPSSRPAPVSWVLVARTQARHKCGDLRTR